MSDVYVIIHITSTNEDHSAYVPKDASEIIELAWIIVDAKSLQEVSTKSQLNFFVYIYTN